MRSVTLIEPLKPHYAQLIFKYFFFVLDKMSWPVFLLPKLCDSNSTHILTLTFGSRTKTKPTAGTTAQEVARRR